MVTKDFLIYESGSGGELGLFDNGFSFVEKIYYQVYLRLFGGNVEASTKGNEPLNQIRQDWWGNSLFNPTKPSKQFNSSTERTLKNVALNSVGRVQINQSVEDDLKYFRNIAKLSVETLILDKNKVEIRVNMSQDKNASNSLLKLIWDNAKNEIITAVVI